MASNRKPIVSFLGPVASYSHQAVKHVFPEDSWTLLPAPTIDDVFLQVQKKQVQAGVVPFENSTNGPVFFTLDNLADRDRIYPDIIVHGDIFIKVHHALLGHKPPPAAQDDNSSSASGPGASGPVSQADSSRPRTTPTLTDLGHIRRLYSHPQAFGQCKAFIAAHLRDAELFDVDSTSKAAQIVSSDQSGSWAAIANELAAEVNSLDLLARSIQDREDNTTRFLIIAASPCPSTDWHLVRQPAPAVGTKSLISFTVSHQSPGALADLLSCFRAFNLNLTSINSRPSLAAPFQYIFFVEFEGHRFDDPDGCVAGALKQIETLAQSWRWLGSWYRYR